MQQTQVFKNRNYQFLALNIAGWLGYCLSSYVGLYYWDKPAKFYYLLLLDSVIGFILTIGLRYVYRIVWNKSITYIVLIALVGSYLSSLLWVIPHNIAYWEWYKGGWEPETWTAYFMGGSNMFYILLCWSCLYFGIKFYQAMEQASQKALKATALAHQSQLKMLRYQLNPHFLFNTLNAISTLILDKSNNRANEMVIRLSNFLRYSLDNDPMQKVTLEQEVMTLELYLGIEKVRFEENLKLDFKIDEEAKDALIPSLILQPLVENSIKYAITKSEDGGTITFRAKVFAQELLLELKDDGPGVTLIDGDLPCGRGVGIGNCKERLKQLYEDRHAFTISNSDPHGLQVNIRLPFEKEQ
jgi:signal transduction histidine kinase